MSPPLEDKNFPDPRPAAEDRFREMVEFLPVIVYETDGEGRLTFANHHAFSFFGYTAEDYQKGLNVLDMIAPEDRERAGGNFRKILQGEKTGEAEYQIVRKDGSPFRGLIASAPILKKGRPVGLRGVVTDISRLRNVEEGLKESEEKFRLLVELSDDGVAWTRGDRHIFVNRRMAEIFGYPGPEAIQQRTVLDMVHPDERERVRRIHAARLQGKGAPKRYEYKGIRQDGETVYIEVSAIRAFYQGEWGSLAFLRDITERRRAEKELQESRELYQTLVEMSNDAVTLVRGDFHEYVNPKMVEIFGYERADEIVGHSLLKMIHPDDRQRVQEINRQRQQGDPVPEKYVFKGIRKDGNPIYLETSARRLQYQGESVSLVFLRDISERVQADRALRESEERSRLIFDTVPDSITITRVADGRYLQVNEYFCQLTGYSREETVGRTVADLNVFVNGQDRERFIRELRERGEVNEYEIQYRKKDGTLFTTLLSARPIRYAGEDCLVAVVTDITKRKQMEEALRKSEERYRLLVDNANEAILVIQEGLIRFVNPKAVKIMHMDGAALAPRPFWEFIHPEDRDMVLQRYQERLAEKELPKTYSFRILDLEGRTIWVEINAVQIIWEGKPAALVFLTDITEKKQLEMQFLQAQKMEAIGRLAGGVAHDFNNLLTSIVGHADLMLLELRPEDPLVGDIREIKKAADRAADLTRQLLAFSRKQILQPRIVNLNQVIADMKKMLRRLIGEDVELETNLAPDPGLVLVDPGQIDQVVMNLVVNARDALPRGGKLTISTARAEITAADVPRYMGSKPGSYVLLEVRDNGLGMSEEVQSHVFEPFFTTKELGKGTGLGLSTVYGIVKQSNGYIWVESEPGVGTAFKIYLPRLEGQAVAESRPKKAASSCRGTETILLVEDNDLVRRLARNVLEQFGYRVLEARNGEEAYRLGRGYEARIDLLLTDVVMPGMSGQTLAGQIREMRPETEVLFMSGYSEESTLNQGTLRGGRHFLQKPFSPQELGQRVRKLLDEKGG